MAVTQHWFNDKFRAVVRYYDELAFTVGANDNPVSVTAFRAIISGGLKGRFSLLRKEARGEWMEITFSDDDASGLTDGLVIWDGMALEFAKTPRP